MNILIIRLSAIGDIFFCTSLLNALKRHHPGCRVTWLTEPPGAGILEGHPQLDRLLVLPRRDWEQSFRNGKWLHLSRSLKGFTESLRREHFDLVIDPQGLWKSAIWARAARADRRIGVNGSDGSALLYDTVVRVPRLERPPVLFDYRLLMPHLGGDPGAIEMNLHVPAADRAEAGAFLAANKARHTVVFCPFTTRPQKHWFDASWAQLGDRLAEDGHGPVVILGGPGDGAGARQIAGLMRHRPVIAAGERRPIGFALGILEQARGVVGVDTGLTHAGIAFGRPTIALFGSTRPYAETGTPRARVLFHDLDCAPCRRRPTCGGRFDCMRLHTPDVVAEQLHAAMRAQASGGPSWIS